jgi:hypothetical protein
MSCENRGLVCALVNYHGAENFVLQTLHFQKIVSTANSHAGQA